MPCAARVRDLHVCLKLTGQVPHVGGPVQPEGAPTVTIGGEHAARKGDHAACLGTGDKDEVKEGSTNVFIGGLPAARFGDKTAHEGFITTGCPTVLIGSSPQAVAIMAASGALVEVCEGAGGGRDRPMEV